MELEFPMELNDTTIHNFEELLEAGENDNPEALNLLGECYFNGLNIKKDHEKGIVYFSKAALLKNTEALINLGNLYENGLLVNKNTELAIDCYVCAYGLGESKGLYQLGLMKINSNENPEDYNLGVAMIREAAKDCFDAEYYWDEYLAETVDSKCDIKYEKILKASEIGPLIFGNISNASTLYGTEMFGAKGATGFAAERANHLYDTLRGHRTQFIGDETNPLTGTKVKNGADRIVDGVQIQTKYFSSGKQCINDCFGSDGMYKYKNSDGSPMVVEVPKDEAIYNKAVEQMEQKIREGKVDGVTDPSKAKELVKRGHFKHRTAARIAKAGTVESITYDMANGAIIATYSFGLSTALSFASAVWNGENYDIALKNATYSGLKVGGTTFVTAVISSQLSKAGLNSALISSSEAVVKFMGPKASAVIVNALKSGKNIYGAAAMKSASKMLRGNVITGTVSVVVFSSVDIVNIFRGRISGAQLFKNVANTASTVAAGSAGWIAGATMGSVVPVIGTVIGGLVGSMAAGALASKATSAVLNEFIEDDAEEMVKIIEQVFVELAEEYLLTRKETEVVVEGLQKKLTGSMLKDMYASDNKKQFAEKLLEDEIDKAIQTRQKITLPSTNDFENSLKAVLEEIAEIEGIVV